MTYRELQSEISRFSDEQLDVDVTTFNGEEIIKCDDLVLPDDVGIESDVLEFDFHPILLLVQG